MTSLERSMHVLYRHEREVQREEIDGLGHASNVAYVVWMQDAAVAHSTANGWSPERYRQLGQGWVARSHKIDYLSPAYERDELVVETWLSGFRNVSCRRRYDIKRRADGVILAKAETRWAYVDLLTGRPRPIENSIMGAFQVLDRD